MNNESVLRCKKCGAQIEPGSVFCANCGARVGGDTPSDQLSAGNESQIPAQNQNESINPVPNQASGLNQPQGQNSGLNIPRNQNQSTAAAQNTNGSFYQPARPLQSSPYRQNQTAQNVTQPAQSIPYRQNQPDNAQQTAQYRQSTQPENPPYRPEPNQGTAPPPYAAQNGGAFSNVPVQKKTSPLKIILIVIAAIVVIAILAVTSLNSLENKLPGTWTATVNFSDYFKSDIEDAVGSEGINISDYTDKEINGELKYTFTFGEDKGCTVTVDQEYYDTFLASLKEYTKDAVLNYIKDEYSEYVSGYSDDEIIAIIYNEDFDTFFNNNVGISIDDVNVFSDVDAYEIVKKDGSEVIRIYNSSGGGTDCTMSAEITGDKMVSSIDMETTPEGDPLPQGEKDALQGLLLTRVS